jgi:hypothetical protein
MMTKLSLLYIKAHFKIIFDKELNGFVLTQVLASKTDYKLLRWFDMKFIQRYDEMGKK